MFRKKNWHHEIDKIRKILGSGGKRKLTLFGKKTINTLVISKLHYNATIVPSLPLKIIQEINTRMFNFFLSKKDRIKRKIKEAFTLLTLNLN